MTDIRRDGPDSAAGSVPAAGSGAALGSAAVAEDSPPPSPWWSRPDTAWGAPDPGGHASTPADDQTPTPADADGGGAQPPYGAYAEREEQPAPAEDPWRQPSTRATFPSSAHAWGAGPDVLADGVGRPEQPRRERRGLGTAVAVLATALVAGLVGGVVGVRSQTNGDLLDPSASLGANNAPAASLDRAPESVAGIAQQVMQSTVSIAVRGTAGTGTGSGVVIRSDGYVLTNNHVVASAANGGTISVSFDGTDGRAAPAQIVGLDPVTDLAVLRIDGEQELPAATLGRSRDLVVGDPVIAIGSPLGLSGTVTTGIVSALNRSPRIPGEGGTSSFLLNAIQTDAAINPGNSGGALVNAAGEVVGINSAIATLGGSPFSGETGGSIGIGFAIPIDEASSVAEEIIRTGRATHPAIGVQATSITDEQADRRGALVREVTPGGAAASVGLQSGDLITAVGGTEVRTVDELILAVRRNSVGDTVTLTYVRQGQERTAEVVLQDLPR